MEREPILLLVLGFLLTGVAGGGLTYFFQQRAWDHQHEVEQRLAIREQSQKVFEELSTLLDQRLYRMRLVFVAARRLARKPGKLDELEGARQAYREVLRKWNDNLNRNLALVHTHFGNSAREHLGGFLFEEFRAIGEELDQFVREATPQDRGAVRVRPILRRLNGLSDAVYDFDLLVVHAIQADQLGPDAPQASTWPARPSRAVMRFGDLGSDVHGLQVALAARPGTDLTVDGHFGLATERALIATQEALNVSERYVAGPETAEALGLAPGSEGTFTTAK